MSVDGRVFWAVALVISALRGIYSENVFGGPTTWSVRHVWESPQRIHQAWFNFIGSLAGWAALWFLIRATWLTRTGELQVTWGSAAFAVVAFAGITGHLPLLFMKLLEGVAALLVWAQRMVEKLLAP